VVGHYYWSCVDGMLGAGGDGGSGGVVSLWESVLRVV